MGSMTNSHLPRIFTAILFALLLAGCATAPLDFPKDHSEAITDTADTRLGKDVVKWSAAHSGQSGFYPLVAGIDALGARLALIDRAERTIDAQYFLMKPDSAGRLFAGKLLEAADRGVRVRLLLDDIFTTVNDDAFVVMNQHPNIELRLFNPVGRGGIYYANYIGDFKLANRRMHNKSFTVDNQISIVGGRNIADEYFELLTDAEFRDFDMLAIGPIAAQISDMFDLYWNHKLAVPMQAYEGRKDLPDLATARAELDRQATEAGQKIYQRALTSPLVENLIADRVEPYPAQGRVVTDDPEKLLNRVSAEHQILVTALATVVDEAVSEVLVITPYFIPGKSGVEFWRSITNKGVRVVVLTNSLASNNHTPVHSGYSRYRRAIIEAGVELYELRVDSSKTLQSDDQQAYDKVTLHTKALVIDREITFVGSLNLDPRSIDINTEMGVLIDNSDMAGELTKKFFANLPSLAYRVTENEKGSLRWTTIIDGQSITETKEPNTSAWLRFKAWFLKILPESQL
jgi:putative cardiolipin synthase